MQENLTEKQSQIAGYLKDHKVTEKLNIYVNCICKTRPENPFKELGKLILQDLPPTIRSIFAYQVFDSRGNPTVAVEVTTDFGTDVAMVPSGASTGAYEALELRDGGDDYMGKGVQKVVKNVNEIIAPSLVGMNVCNQEEIDTKMIKELDGSKNQFGWSKSKLGANAILGVSMAVCRAGARANNIPLYKYIASLAKNPVVKIPMPEFNVINGGEHAGNNLAFQEFMIQPRKAKTFDEGMKIITEVYHNQKKIIKKRYGIDATNIGDEGGFAPNIGSAEEGLDLLRAAIEESGHQGKIAILIDLAASSFYFEDKGYDLYYKDSEKKGTNYMSAEQFCDYLKNLLKQYPEIISLEDPFHEQDFDGFAKQTSDVGNEIQIVGDDLTVTNPTLIQMAVDRKACNAQLMKQNQIGTVTETIRAVSLARKNSWSIVASHRSGETEDTFLADMAVGLNCGQIKTGAPARSERLSKYNRLARIEQEGKAPFVAEEFRNPGPVF